MVDGSPWPRVSIVTPSYSQAQFIEETIRSVLLQGYPNLEYIIIDGGSTDGSMEIIRQYEPWLAYWVSEGDRGQSHAINKGWALATGEIAAWINSDDLYLAQAVERGVSALMQTPEAVLVYGNCEMIREDGSPHGTWTTHACTLHNLLLEGNKIPQPTVFMRTSALSAVGGVDETLSYVMDYALWVQLGLHGSFEHQASTVARFRLHETSKSTLRGFRFFEEWQDWLNRWTMLDMLLSSVEQDAMKRRIHLRIATEYLFAEKPEMAAPALRFALRDGHLPYPTLDVVAEKLCTATGLDGQQAANHPTFSMNLQQALQRADAGEVERHLYRKIVSRQYMRSVFRAYQTKSWAVIRQNIWHGLWYDPDWLKNRGVWSILCRAYGPPIRRW